MVYSVPVRMALGMGLLVTVPLFVGRRRTMHNLMTGVVILGVYLAGSWRSAGCDLNKQKPFVRRCRHPGRA